MIITEHKLIPTTDGSFECTCGLKVSETFVKLTSVENMYQEHLRILTEETFKNWKLNEALTK